jgi:hypothetical protein
MTRTLYRIVKSDPPSPSDGHYTVWGEPDDLLNLVTSVQIIGEATNEDDF